MIFHALIDISSYRIEIAIGDTFIQCPLFQITILLHPDPSIITIFVHNGTTL